MNIETRAAASSANRVFAALAVLLLALFALGVSAPAAWADQKPTLKVTSWYGDYDGQPHSASVSIVGENTEGYYLVFTNAKGEVLNDNPTRTDVGTEEFMVTMYDSKAQTAYFTNFYISIEPRNVTVNITGNTESCAYDGQPHAAKGYTVDSIVVQKDQNLANPAYTESDFTILEGQEAKVTGTDAGNYPMHLYSIDFANLNSNFNATFKVTDGALNIAPRNVTVNVAGDSLDTTYDGDEKSITGFTPGAIEVEEIEGLATPLYANTDYSMKKGVTAEVTRTNAGTYYMGLTKDDFVNNNDNFNATFKVTDGVLSIAPRAVDVYVAGNAGVLFYDGTRQSFEGWEVTSYEVSQIAEVPLPDFDESSVSLKDGAAAKASGTAAGTYPMNLTPESFECTDLNFDATFHVTDGMLTIVAADEEDGDDKGGKSKKDDADEESGEPSGTPKTADAADLALPVALIAGAAAAAMAARSRRRKAE